MIDKEVCQGKFFVDIKKKWSFENVDLLILRLYCDICISLFRLKA